MPSWVLTLAQGLCAAAFLVGLAVLAGWPWALAVGGPLGFVACEVAERGRVTSPARTLRAGRDADGDRR